MISKKADQGNSQLVKVTFTLPNAIKAKAAYIVGDFNGWSKTSTPMRLMHNGTWQITLDLERGREYQFRYLVNGTEWHNDWHPDKYAVHPYGGENSVVCT